MYDAALACMLHMIPLHMFFSMVRDQGLRQVNVGLSYLGTPVRIVVMVDLHKPENDLQPDCDYDKS